MDAKWIEEIKHNDGIVLLNRFFPEKVVVIPNVKNAVSISARLLCEWVL